MKVFKSILIVILFLGATVGGLYVGNAVIQHKFLYNKVISFVEAAKPFEGSNYDTEKEKREFFEQTLNNSLSDQKEENVLRLIYETEEKTVNAYYGKDYYLMIEEKDFEKHLYYLYEENIYKFKYDSLSKKYEYVGLEKEKFLNLNENSTFKEYFDLTLESYNKHGLKGSYTKYFDYTSISNKSANYYDFVGYFGYNETDNASEYCFEGTMNTSFKTYKLNIFDKKEDKTVLKTNFYLMKKDTLQLPEEVYNCFYE